MSINAAATLSRAMTILQDETGVRWPLAELRQWFNDALREITLLKPTAASSSVVVALDPGTYQKLPARFTRVLRVTRNLRAQQDSPRLGGRPIRTVDRDMLDSQAPDWHDERRMRRAREVRNACVDDAEPTAFWVYPGNDGKGFVEVVASKIPDGIPAPAQHLDDLASYAATIELQDIYSNVLLDYVLYRAFSKEAQFAGSAQRAAAYYQQFVGALHASSANDAQLSPNAAAASPQGVGQ